MKSEYFRAIVESIPMPDIPARVELAGEEEATGDLAIDAALTAAAQPQTVIGSQLVQFDAAFPQDIRTDCSSGFLLAQLAADRATLDSGMTGAEGAQHWQTVYLDTLTRLGWILERKSASSRTASATSGHVHKEIVPVLTAALGGTAGAALIVGLLNGLQEMSPDSPWITLFDQQSRHASAHLFQVSYGALVGDTPAMSVVCFQLTALREVTQVLFFRLGDTTATLDHFEVSLRLNRAAFDAVRDVVAKRVFPFLADHVAEIKI
jgi:hypothetical protein